MKALKFFILVSIGLVLSSCSMEDEINVQEITSKNVIAEIKATGAKGIPFPEGSKATTLGSKDFVKITLPEDVYYVIKDEEGNVSRVSTLGIRCKCLKGAGCSPGTYDGRYFCTAELGACSLCEVHAGLIESLSAKGEQKEVQIVGVMPSFPSFPSLPLVPLEPFCPLVPSVPFALMFVFCPFTTQ